MSEQLARSMSQNLELEAKFKVVEAELAKARTTPEVQKDARVVNEEDEAKASKKRKIDNEYSNDIIGKTASFFNCLCLQK